MASVKLHHLRRGKVFPAHKRSSSLESGDSTTTTINLPMSNAVKRSVLRWIHIIITIPIFGYIYGPPAEVQQYAAAVRYLFVPIIVLSGLWMYAGLLFGIIGVLLLLGSYYFYGYGVAVLSQVALFIARKIWLLVSNRFSKRSNQANEVG